jgi:hypothetical protein
MIGVLVITSLGAFLFFFSQSGQLSHESPGKIPNDASPAPVPTTYRTLVHDAPQRRLVSGRFGRL